MITALHNFIGRRSVQRPKGLIYDQEELTCSKWTLMTAVKLGMGACYCWHQYFVNRKRYGKEETTKKKNLR